MKVLNLYAGIGGNRALWRDVEVTAIELDPAIAEVYKKRFPDDLVLCSDANLYLEHNFEEFDFIWSSPPCQSHGQYRHNVGVLGKGFKPILPDMTLYSQIVFLKTYYNGIWVVENTRPYYEPLVEPSFELQRHLFWSSGTVPYKEFRASEIRTKNKIEDFAPELAALVKDSKISNKRQALRNCVDEHLGKYVFDELTKSIHIPPTCIENEGKVYRSNDGSL